MKETTLMAILIGVFVIIALIGIALILKMDNSKLGEKIVKVSGSFISGSLLAWIVLSNFNNDYSIYKEQMIWETYNLPQIDSSMFLDHLNHRWSIYNSHNRDSIYHRIKYTRYDMIDIYSIEDEFINKHNNKMMMTTFIIPNVIRDSSRLTTLTDISDFNNKLVDTLNYHQFDSVLIDWGLKEKYIKS